MNKTVISVIVGAVILLIVIFFVGKAYGKKTPPKKLPDPGDIVDDVTTYDPTAMTDKLWGDIDGISWLYNHDIDIYNELITLSDTNLVKVMNDWDKRYFSKHSETLLQAINGEYYFLDDNDIIDALKARLTKLEATRKK